MPLFLGADGLRAARCTEADGAEILERSFGLDNLRFGKRVFLRQSIGYDEDGLYFREIASAREAVGSHVKTHYRAALDIRTLRDAKAG